MLSIPASTVRSALLLATGALTLPALAAQPAEWSPGKPVRMIVGFPPGGATDLVARILQPKMGAGLGQQIVVDNRPGANGVISNELLARAEPDGLTTGFTHIGTMVISPAIQKVPYDRFNDFASIGQMVSLQNLIVTHPTLPVKNLKELIALAKARPGELNYATSGVGSPGHLATGLLESMTGIRMSHVPYKGGGPAMVDTIAGHVTIFTSVISTGVPFVQSGKVRGIAVTGDRRAEAIPNVPTVAEGGVKGYSATNWYGLMAPAKTPRNVIDRLNKELNAALRAPEIVQQLRDRGIDATPGTPEEYTAFIRAEDKKWTPLIKKLDIKDAS